MATLTPQDILRFAEDLYAAFRLELKYLDDQNDLQQISAARNEVRITMPEQTALIRPHNPELKTVEVPLARVLYATVYQLECDRCNDPEDCEYAKSVPPASWFIHNGRPYLLS